MTRVKEVIDRIGGEAEVAKVTGLRPVSIRTWARDGYIPPKHHEAVMERCKELGLDVTVQDLDPAA